METRTATSFVFDGKVSVFNLINSSCVVSEGACASREQLSSTLCSSMGSTTVEKRSHTLRLQQTQDLILVLGTSYPWLTS